MEHMLFLRHCSLTVHLGTVWSGVICVHLLPSVIAITAMSQRSDIVCQYVNDLPWNRASYPRLIECGYKESLWTEVSL